MLKLMKFVVQAVLVVEDEEGNITREISGDKVAVFGFQGLKDYADAVAVRLSEETTRAA